MLPNTKIVTELYTTNGVFDAVKQGALVIDSSTIEPSGAVDLNGIAS